MSSDFCDGIPRYALSTYKEKWFTSVLYLQRSNQMFNYIWKLDPLRTLCCVSHSWCIYKFFKTTAVYREARYLFSS